ncbi:hypothetical protein GGR52DRAFT_438086 [Hypoxylon sp. FL1284]|nr:hypothetical protein GGR52DRAFT_438086 [Hypoxylon sp. FL1284]
MSGNWASLIPRGSNTKSQSSELAKSHGPPYASNMALVGGVPSPGVDDPVAAVLMVLFLLSAAAHMTILRINKRRNLKFVFSGMLFGLCMLRSVSLVARMIWASYPNNVNALIASSVMTQCGSVLIFIINLFFAQRILRAYHPRLGWHRGACYAVWFLIACVLCCLIMAIITTIHTFFTVSRAARQSDRAVQLFAGLYLAILAFLPVPIVVVAVAAARPHQPFGDQHRFRRRQVEKFGAGRWRSKVGLLLFTSLVATLGAGFRVGVNFGSRPGMAAAWFHSRASYYCFNFLTDLIVSTAYLLARFDRRFLVPDGARGPGDYSPVAPSSPTLGLHDRGPTGDAPDKLPRMGSEKPLVMMRNGPISGRATITGPPFEALASMSSLSLSPSSSPLASPLASPPHSRDTSPAPLLRLGTNAGNNDMGVKFGDSGGLGFNTDSSSTAVQNTPTTSSSISRGRVAPPPPLPPQHRDRRTYMARHQESRSQQQTQPQLPSSSVIASTSASRAAGDQTNSTSGRLLLLTGCMNGRNVMRSVRIRINSEADAYGPDGSCSGGHSTDTDPLVGSSSSSPAPASPSLSPAAARRQYRRYPRHHHHPQHHHLLFLGRSRGVESPDSGQDDESVVSRPALAHLGPPILPDLNLDSELLSATLLAPWALNSWGFSPSRRSSRRQSGCGGGGGNGGKGKEKEKGRAEEGELKEIGGGRKGERVELEELGEGGAGVGSSHRQDDGDGGNYDNNNNDDDNGDSNSGYNGDDYQGGDHDNGGDGDEPIIESGGDGDGNSGGDSSDNAPDNENVDDDDGRGWNITANRSNSTRSYDASYGANSDTEKSSRREGSPTSRRRPRTM